jgi:ATP-dependent protease ClpP protease subunit
MNFIKKLMCGLLLSISAHAAEKVITLTADNTLIFDEQVDSMSAGEITAKAAAMDAHLQSGYPIYLVLYTPGGEIQKGLELIDYLKSINRPTHTITMFAASMGFQMSQQLGMRYITRFGVLMSHKARGGFEGEFGGGMSQLDSRYGLWLRRIDMMDKHTVSRTKGKQTLTSYRAAYQTELWLNGQEAVDGGYADEVVTIKCDSTLQGVRFKEFNSGFMIVKVSFSNCPSRTGAISVTASLYTTKGLMTLSNFLANNGQFGEKCGANKSDSNYEYVNGHYVEVERKDTEPLCAQDKTLTLEKIQGEIKLKQDYYNSDLKDRIKRSY